MRSICGLVAAIFLGMVGCGKASKDSSEELENVNHFTSFAFVLAQTGQFGADGVAPACVPTTRISYQQNPTVLIQKFCKSEDGKDVEPEQNYSVVLDADTFANIPSWLEKVNAIVLEDAYRFFPTATSLDGSPVILELIAANQEPVAVTLDLTDPSKLPDGLRELYSAHQTGRIHD